MMKTRCAVVAGVVCACVGPGAGAGPVSFELFREAGGFGTGVTRITPDGRHALWRETEGGPAPAGDRWGVRNDGTERMLPGFMDTDDNAVRPISISNDGSTVLGTVGARRNLLHSSALPYWLEDPGMPEISAVAASSDAQTLVVQQQRSNGRPERGARTRLWIEGRLWDFWEGNPGIPNAIPYPTIDQLRITPSGDFAVGSVVGGADVGDPFALGFPSVWQLVPGGAFPVYLVRARTVMNGPNEGELHRGRATDISDDGTIAVGYSQQFAVQDEFDEDEYTLLDVIRPIVWRNAHIHEDVATMEFLGGHFIDDAREAVIDLVSGDGSVFVGRSIYGESTSVRWVRYADGRVYSFEEIALRAGLDPGVIELARIVDIDYEGDTLAGWVGVGNEQYRAFVFNIPAPSGLLVLGLGGAVGLVRRRREVLS